MKLKHLMIKRIFSLHDGLQVWRCCDLVYFRLVVMKLAIKYVPVETNAEALGA